MSERKIWIARHGHRQDFSEPDWRKKAQRPDDPPLSDLGHQQAEKIAEYLRDKQIDHIFASPYIRTIQTANPTAEVLGHSINIEPGLAEWLNPDWFSGKEEELHMSMEKLSKEFDLVNPDYQAREWPSVPEDGPQMLKRTKRTLKVLLEDFSGNLLILTHGASLIGFVRSLTGTTVMEVDVASITSLQQQGKSWKVAKPAGTAHLDGPGTGWEYSIIEFDIESCEI